MPCLHGLDEINCHICRIVNHTEPEKLIRAKDIKINTLKPKNQLFEDNIREKNSFKDKLSIKRDFHQIDIINPIKASLLLNNLPNFKNKMFLKRLEEIDLKNPDKFGISKKISLESPEWKFERKEDNKK